MNITKLNNDIARRLTLLVSSMACFYIFLLWSLLPLIFPATQNIVFYSSSAILQLTLLPLIMVGQSILNRNSEIRSEEDHKTVVQILVDIQALITENKLLIAENKLVKDDQILEIADLNEIENRLERLELLLSHPPRS